MATEMTYRTIWVSDFHLGSRNCRADFLIDFLKRNHSETLYLVGDIIDGWQIKSDFYWPANHLNVIREILDKAKKGVKVTYLPGNHDEFLRNFDDFNLSIGSIRITDRTVHTTVDGKKMLVMHGDQFDTVVRHYKWLAHIGDYGYQFLMWVNRHLNHFRRWLGYGYWSLSAYIKYKVKEAVNYISKFEEMLVEECREKGLQGVVCGHIHKAELKDVNGTLYANSGDWVESCTALVEHFDGRLEIINWVEPNDKHDKPVE
jgi:UDP-2,3-diacylglucosamine pyrophosphatase LpxH